ncbi:MAG TPA: Xaa-Pro peptidase family protein [Phycisphaerales bacterium]|nr:Xaa-Pro peptidase family protein [Phycisphaerales bacterium]HRQ76316.1 Xaa-Pro peptidase family protein [Phycisphaerales bacterium]
MSGNRADILPDSLRDACLLRQERLRRLLREAGIDALLVSTEKDIRYLTGFIGHDSLFLIHADGGAIISDARYDEFLNPWRDAGTEALGKVVMGTRHRLEESVRTLCEAARFKRVGVQAEHMTLLRKARLSAAISSVTLVETSGLVARLRMKKDAMEIDAIRRAIGIQQDALAAVLDELELGMSETQFCAALEFEMKSRGASGPSFDAIIGAGANSSVPHHLTGQTTIREGVLLVDWGAAVDGYHSDLTRTFGVGSMPARIREIYAIVLEAQLAAIDAIVPGKVCAEIDAVARKIITDAGYGEQFGHGLGHGLGMDTHEPPFFNSLQTDVVLEPGMVMTVEPGIYLPGVGGVRIEDDVLVTEGGAEVLSDWPKDIERAMLPIAQGVRR